MSAVLPFVTAPPGAEAPSPGEVGTAPPHWIWLEALVARLEVEHAPANATERHLVWRLAAAMWRSEQVFRRETEAWAEGGAVALHSSLLRYQVQLRREVRASLRLLSEAQRRRRKRGGPRMARLAPSATPEVSVASTPVAGPADLAMVEAWLEDAIGGQEPAVRQCGTSWRHGSPRAANGNRPSAAPARRLPSIEIAPSDRATPGSFRPCLKLL